MEVEDAIPEGIGAGPWGRAGRAKRVPRWLVPVQAAGYAAAVLLFLAMANATRTAVDTRIAYDTAPVCTVGKTSQCGPDAVTLETITVTGSTVITDAKNEPEGLVLEFTDPSGLLAGGGDGGGGGGGEASFHGDETPSLGSATGAGQQFTAQLWRGALMWMAAPSDPGGDRYYADGSVANTTKYTLFAPAVVGGIDFVYCCSGWWLLVRRGRVSDRGSFRPLFALGCLIVTAWGWELLARTESSGIGVMGAGLVAAALLGLPLPGTRPAAGWRGWIRSRRARRAARPSRNEIFR